MVLLTLFLCIIPPSSARTFPTDLLCYANPLSVLSCDTTVPLNHYEPIMFNESIASTSPQVHRAPLINGTCAISSPTSLFLTSSTNVSGICQIPQHDSFTLYMYFPHVILLREWDKMYMHPYFVKLRFHLGLPLSSYICRPLNPLFLWLLQINAWNGLLVTIMVRYIYLIRRKLLHRFLFQRESTIAFSNIITLHSDFAGSISKSMGHTCAPPPKPPDAIDVTHEVHNIRARRLLTLYRLVKLSTLIPFVMMQSQADFRSSITGLVASNGLLQTGDMSATQTSALRHQLSLLPKGLLSTDHVLDAVADTGASSFASFSLDDMVPGSYQAYSTPKTMTGIASGLDILGEGISNYEVVGQNGRIHKIRRKQYYIPQLPVRLIPPQCIFPTDADGYFRINGESAALHFSDGGHVPVEIVPSINLPILRLYHNAQACADATASSLYSCVTEETNQNLSRTQKFLLLMTFRLGHVAMPFVQWLGRHGVLGESGKALGGVTDIPLCATCQYAKQRRRANPAIRSVPRPSVAGNLSKGNLQPGDVIAMDQFEVVTRGRLFHTRGLEPIQDKYRGGTIFINMATGYVRLFHQVTLSAAKTICSKIIYEREANEVGNFIKSYHSDNGVFTARTFQGLPSTSSASSSLLPTS